MVSGIERKIPTYLGSMTTTEEIQPVSGRGDSTVLEAVFCGDLHWANLDWTRE